MAHPGPGHSTAAAASGLVIAADPAAAAAAAQSPPALPQNPAHGIINIPQESIHAERRCQKAPTVEQQNTQSYPATVQGAKKRGKQCC
jgi:hypothetical protein